VQDSLHMATSAGKHLTKHVPAEGAYLTKSVILRACETLLHLLKRVRGLTGERKAACNVDFKL
jgi:hypothetical protein